ncbi:hypothetical protein CO661_17390 [Sinorhizobium fredii]|uniref:Uncharacterized protein n=1 Tax=Rhizobium fredii TaxID=380 RepID=A0A2A6LWS1_RHIFR|nr:hypothetical protein [Sinorhizobium fredii]PDT46676.1 hypothetical protein CO661_17390 [Sinorhizobium fredii]
MKRPQRNFLVEYKTSRRQKTKPRGNSIWGDADLKALARAIEEHSHPGSLVDPPSDMPTGSGEVQQANFTGHDFESDSSTAPPALPITDISVEAKREPDPKASSVFAVTAAPAFSRRTAKVRNTSPKARNRPATPAATEVDELDFLETENRCLKELLAERLRAENQKLRRMMERL